MAGPLDDARDNIVAGRVSEAILAISIGAIGVNAPDEEGYTLLHHAARVGSLDGVTQLLDRGADPTIAARNGDIALKLATNPDVRAALIAAMPAQPATPAPAPAKAP
ncbi:hypothetical protein LWE61_07960 [Sphingobium sufflavum]|nr:hypothetical protein [Sphingobium sufflavum]